MPLDMNQLPNQGVTATAIRNVYARRNQSEQANDISKIIDKFYDSRENGYNSQELKDLKVMIEAVLAKYDPKLSAEEKELLGDILTQCNQATLDKAQRRKDIDQFLSTTDTQKAWDQFFVIADKYNSNLKVENLSNVSNPTELKTTAYKFSSTEAIPGKQFVIDADKFLGTLDSKCFRFFANIYRFRKPNWIYNQLKSKIGELYS